MDQSIAFSRSTDGGVSWSPRGIVSGPGPREGQKSQWGFPVVSSSGRIYVFYNKSTGIGYGALLECKYSDDDGYTWMDGGVEIPYRRTKWDHPDPKVQPNCIIWQKATRDSKGRQVVPLTHGTHIYVKPHLNAGSIGGTSKFLSDLGEMRCEFLRFDNIDEGPDPKDLELTWLPDDEDLVSVPMTAEPWASAGYSFCQEPGLVLLPDGRLFTEMRTANGDIWYTVSDDDGHTWRKTEVLRYRGRRGPDAQPDLAVSDVPVRGRPLPHFPSEPRRVRVRRHRPRWTSTADVPSSSPSESTARALTSRCGSASPCSSVTRRWWASSRTTCTGCRSIRA